MSNLLAKYQFTAFFGITCHGTILSPTEKLIDTLLGKIYFILIYLDKQRGLVSIFDYAGKVTIPNDQNIDKQIKKMGPTYTTLGSPFVHSMPFIANILKY